MNMYVSVYVCSYFTLEAYALKQIFLPYKTYMPQMPITSCAHETTMSVYIPHMNLLQSTM